MKDDGQIYGRTQEQLAIIFGVDARTIKRWLAHGAPKKTGSGYDLLAWGRWLSERRQEQFIDETTAEAVRRCKVADAALKELRLSRERGDLVPREMHDRELLMRSQWIIGVLQRLPALFAPLVGGRSVSQAKRVMDRECRRLRKQVYGESDDR